MKIVFLDVDGVIKPINSETPVNGLGAVCTANLKELLKKTGAKIVLSTSWREDKRDLAFLEHSLSQHGIDPNSDIVGMTPVLWQLGGGVWDDDEGEFTKSDSWLGTRGHEIQKFLESNLIDIDKFVVLDDDPTPAKIKWDKWNNGKFIQTNMSVGFDEEKLQQALDFFNN